MCKEVKKVQGKDPSLMTNVGIYKTAKNEGELISQKHITIEMMTEKDNLKNILRVEICFKL